MVEKVSQADIAYQEELWIGRTVAEATTWTQILGIKELSMPESVPEDVDATHMQSPGRTKETIPGLLPVADWSQDKQYWAGDPGDVLLDELAALTEAGTSEDVLVEFKIDDSRRTYRGYVNSFTIGGTVGELRMATVAMKIFERQATNDRVEA
ncbi:hypothetical protein DL1_11945 [Thioclava dalianensis]|uniref:Lambda phage tail tube protein N-terminal domain-containing protein n=1 Tax=Thioclava dalianensis TaxID=1185766 RepID=A0A074T9R7_9RHOB|nr:phage tail tube protein [Thioclava dalianensis]KEP68434.1 hypothetical protein DL1_11945 [Thioclava dalianensis]SFN62676.1 hypothetical protein SAMN05216224_10853 [Thioclava dalianensis]